MKTAIVGGGRIARQHLSALERLPGVRVEAVCDLSSAVAESVAERYRIPAYFTDFATMLEETRPDVVHVTTPPASHFLLARQALNAGCHVFLEKPAAAEESEIEELLDLARAKGLHLVEDYNYLFNSPVLGLRRLISEGAFGRLLHVEAAIQLDLASRFPSDDAFHPAHSLARGVISDFLTHFASLVVAFAGKPASIGTIWEKEGDSTNFSYDEFRALLRCEHATAALRFSGSAQPDGFFFTAFGTQMTVRANLFEGGLVTEKTHRGPAPLSSLRNAFGAASTLCRSSVYGFWRKLGGAPCGYEGIGCLLENFYSALCDGGPMPVEPDIILEVNRLVFELQNERRELCVFSSPAPQAILDGTSSVSF